MTDKLPTPLRSIRNHCLWCCCEVSKEVALCPADDCSLWPFRSGKGSQGKGGLMKPIRLRCLDCSGGSSHEVDKCTHTWCNLYPYRYGKRVKKAGAKKRVASAASIAALKKLHEK